MAEAPDGWEMRGKPPTLFRRFEFARYGLTRDFLDALANLTEETGVHPQNISFGTTYVNITIEASDGVALSETEHNIAARISGLWKSEGA